MKKRNGSRSQADQIQTTQHPAEGNFATNIRTCNFEEPRNTLYVSDKENLYIFFFPLKIFNASVDKTSSKLKVDYVFEI